MPKLLSFPQSPSPPAPIQSASSENPDRHSLGHMAALLPLHNRFKPITRTRIPADFRYGRVHLEVNLVLGTKPTTAAPVVVALGAPIVSVVVLVRGDGRVALERVSSASHCALEPRTVNSLRDAVVACGVVEVMMVTHDPKLCETLRRL